MSFEAATNGAALLSNRRKQTNPKQLPNSTKQEQEAMTVVESGLGSFYENTPRGSLDVPPPLLQLTSKPRSSSDGNIVTFHHLQQKRNSFPNVGVLPSDSSTGDAHNGPPPLARVSPTPRPPATTSSKLFPTDSQSAEQPINLSTPEVNKKRSSGSNQDKIEEPGGKKKAAGVLDLSAKTHLPVIDEQLALATLAAVFAPPKAHSRQKLDLATKYCRLCSCEIELALLNDTGLCAGCQLRKRQDVQHPPASTTDGQDRQPTGVVNPFNSLAVPGAANFPNFPNFPPLDFANALARLPLFSPSIFAGSTIQQQLADSILPRDHDRARKKERKSPPVLPPSDPPAVDSSQQQQFYCAKCNIEFRNAKSLEAHVNDYCQKSGRQNAAGGRTKAGTKRRSMDTSTGQDLVCQLCGYHGHSERGIRVHFNAMHSIGSEIQLEQYLTTMIIRADPLASKDAEQQDATKSDDVSDKKDGAGKSDEKQVPLETGEAKKRRTSLPASPSKPETPNANAAKRRSSKNVMMPTVQVEQAQVPQPSVSANSSNSSSSSSNASTLRRQPPFECRLCSKTFPDTAKLRLHMRSHEREEAVMYSCKRCNKFTTSVKSDLVRHVKTEHEGANMRISTWTVTCNASGHAANASCELSNGGASNSSDSSDDGPRFCDICQISFRFKHSYDAHRKYYCMAKWTDSTNTGEDNNNKNNNNNDSDADSYQHEIIKINENDDDADDGDSSPKFEPVASPRSSDSRVATPSWPVIDDDDSSISVDVTS